MSINYSQAKAMPNSMFKELKPVTGSDELKPLAGGQQVTEAEAAAAADNTKISSLVGDGSIPGGSGPSITSNPTMGSSVNLGGLLEGKLTIELFDALVPALLVTVLYYFKIKLKKSDLQLTASEKSIVTPVLQQCLNSINMNFTSPWQALGAVLVFIYGSKVAEKAGVVWIDELNEKKSKKADNPPKTETTISGSDQNNIKQPEVFETSPKKYMPENKDIQKLMRRTKQSWKICKERLIAEGPGIIEQ